MNTTEGKLEWFGGNQDGVNLFRSLVTLLHTWDDLVDKDKPVSETQVNEAFLIALVQLPANPLYRAIQADILPMWVTIVSAYEAANSMERSKDPHGLEIAHSLRYAAGHIIAYAMQACIGASRAREFTPDMWKAVFYERFDDYRKEHLNVDPQ
jgi:hypothetical protein